MKHNKVSNVKELVRHYVFYKYFLRKMEKSFLKASLISSRYSQRAASPDIGIPKSTLCDKISKHGICVKDLAEEFNEKGFDIFKEYNQLLEKEEIAIKGKEEKYELNPPHWENQK